MVRPYGVPSHPGFAPVCTPSKVAWSMIVAGSETAVASGRSPATLRGEAGPGVTLTERLESLAVHDAYHLGKIVAPRQIIDAWPPPGRRRAPLDLLAVGGRH